MLRLLLVFPFCFFLSNVAIGNTCENKIDPTHMDNYEYLVCEGDDKFKKGLYEKASEDYLSASKIKFVEVPNYKLNAKIAHAFLMSGDVDKAKHYIEKSELILSVLTGIYSCEEREDVGVELTDENIGDFHFISKDGITPLDSPLNKEVMLVMCGGAYSSFYNTQSKTFKGVVSDGKLVEEHMNIYHLIYGKD